MPRPTHPARRREPLLTEGKVCSDCDVYKDANDYYPRRGGGRAGQIRGGLNSACKQCMRARGKEYSRRNRTQVNLMAKYREREVRAGFSGLEATRRARDVVRALADAGHDLAKLLIEARKKPAPPSSKSRHLLRSYGIDEGDKAAMLEAQGGVCACCAAVSPGSKTGWAVDHDHATGAIRGVICAWCNITLGRLGDNEPAIKRTVSMLVAYLQRAQESPPLERPALTNRTAPVEPSWHWH